MPKPIQTVTELFPDKWLTPQHLQGKRVQATISAVAHRGAMARPDQTEGAQASPIIPRQDPTPTAQQDSGIRHRNIYRHPHLQRVGGNHHPTFTGRRPQQEGHDQDRGCAQTKACPRKQESGGHTASIGTGPRRSPDAQTCW